MRQETRDALRAHARDKALRGIGHVLDERVALLVGQDEALAALILERDAARLDLEAALAAAGELRRARARDAVALAVYRATRKPRRKPSASRAIEIPAAIVVLAARTPCRGGDGFMDPLGLLAGETLCPDCRRIGAQ